MKRYAVSAGAAALFVLVATPAMAHVTANPNSAAAGSFFRTAFRVGHGCEGSPTRSVAIKVPLEEGLTSVHAEQVPGWDVEVKTADLPEPVEIEGEEVTEGVSEVVWTATTPMPDEHFQEFGLTMRVPDEVEAGVLWFPTVQTCVEGEHRWVTIPDSIEAWGEEDEPSPYVEVTAAEGDGHGVADEADSADAAAQTDGDEGDDDIDVLVIVALALGAIGALLGALALARSGRRA